MRTIPTCSILYPLLLVAPACSGGGGGGGEPGGSASGGTTSTVDLLLTDGPADELSSFRATVLDVRLLREDGTSTPNLLDDAVTIEFLGLQDQFAWVARDTLPPGEYEGVRAEFDGDSLEARDLFGEPVPVVALSTTLEAEFDDDLELSAGGYARVALDLVLEDSLDGSVDSPPLTFDPSGIAFEDSDDDETDVDEIEGIVTAVDSTASTITVDAFVDGDLTVPLGEIVVLIDDSTLLLDDDDDAFGGAGAFFAALQVGITQVEVHGPLGSDGTVAADKIQIEDDAGNGGAAVEVEGRVLGIDAEDSEFVLLVESVEEGVQQYAQVLAALDFPATIVVGWDESTALFLDSDKMVGEDALEVGQDVEVRFEHFVLPEPFLASEIEIDGDDDAIGFPAFDGTIVDTSELPDAIIVALDDSDPAVVSGLVSVPGNRVVVELDDTPICLDTKGQPQLKAGQLLEGLEVRIWGVLDVDHDEDDDDDEFDDDEFEHDEPEVEIEATKLRVEAGRLKWALVTETFPDDGSLDTVGGDLKEPFGEGVGFGPQRIDLAPGVEFHGLIKNADELWAAFATGEGVEVDVRGIGAGEPNRILAYQVHAKFD